MARRSSVASRLRAATVLLTVMTLAVAVTSSPAGATTPGQRQTPTAVNLVPPGAEYECLTNDSGVCISQEVVVITTNVISTVASTGVIAATVYLVKKFIGWWNNPGPGKH